MKRFLKPTGQILTTAVFTSTALDTLLPSNATSAPPPETTPPDASRPLDTSPQTPKRLETVIPPEALSAQEFTQPSAADSDSAPYTIHSDVSLPVFPGEPNVDATDAAEKPSDPRTATPPATERRALEPDGRPPANPLAVRSRSVELNRVSEANISEIRRYDDPMLRRTASGRQRPTGSPSPAAVTPGSGGRGRDADAETVSQSTGSQSTDPAATVQDESGRQETAPDALEATREWLDEKLASLVERDRSTREVQLRENLIATAHDYVAARKFEEARHIAANPVLTDADRDDLLTAIADAENSPFFPFLPADQAVTSSTPQGRRPTPNREWLMSRMNALVTNFHQDCDAEASAATIAALAQTQSPNSVAFASAPRSAMGGPAGLGALNTRAPRTAVSSGVPGMNVAAVSAAAAKGTAFRPSDTEFSSGSDFLAGVGQQAPSSLPKRSIDVYAQRTSPAPEASETMAIAPNCTPSFGQNVGGLTFATLSGYQWLTQLARSSAQPWRMILPLPIPAAITSRFGWRTHPIYGNRRFHFGIDFGAPRGTPILAALPGRVDTGGYLDGYGLTVIIENEELEQRNLYAHMSGIAVQPGTWVEQGTVIGWVGSTGNSTGPHLHFEVHRRTADGWVAVDPLQAAAQLIANQGR